MNKTISLTHHCFSFLIFLFLVISVSSQDSALGDDQNVELVGVKKIWSKSPHNAFTDLVFWKNHFYCAFREGKGHAGDRGKLRIIRSETGEKWETAGLLEMEVFDLRDAALSITPDGRMMVLGGAQSNANGKRQTGTFVSFTDDGASFTKPKMVIPGGRWLWRVTWHKDHALGVAYGAPHDRESSSLLRTADGVNYETVTKTLLSKGGWPTEARLRFDDEGKCYCLHRRDGSETSAFLGIASPPYNEWEWKDLNVRIGGPNFIRLPDGKWIGAGRLYDGQTRTELFTIDVVNGTIKPILRLPSGGDTSYPGMVWHKGMLWVSYYSSHEGQTCIYLAKVRFTDSAPIDLGTRLEPFVDRYLIAQQDNTELKIHHPRPAERVLDFDKPWEGAFCGYVTVLNAQDRFQMYYRGLPQVGGDGSNHEVTCYAESTDGIRWTKPELGIHEYKGSTRNNIVVKGETPASHNFCPFLDARPNVPAAEKYKALGGTAKGLLAFVSPDGINWKRLREKPVFTQGVFDSQNVSFYSTSEKQYVCYFRTWTGKGYRGFRSISKTTSRDFINWTKPVAMTFGDNPNEHLYTNQTSPYFRAPHLSIGIAARFMPGRRVLDSNEAKKIGVDPKYFGDISDAVLLTTRGGHAYERTFMESFIRPGIGLENWVSRTNYPALGIIPAGKNEMSLFIQKNYGQPTSHLRRYTLRVDGFASVNGRYQPGEMITKNIRFGEKRTTVGRDKNLNLVLNASTSAAGGIRVEIQDQTGTPVPGYELDNCYEVIGDRVNHTVRWKGKSDVSELQGKVVRIRFRIKDADLFSIQFRPAE